MIQFICYFLPAFLAIYIINKVDNNKIFDFKYIIYYFNIVLFINLANSIVLNFIFKNGDYVLNSNSFTNYFILKYLILSIFFAILISSFYLIIKRKNISIQFYIIKKKNTKILIPLILTILSTTMLVVMYWLKKNLGDIPFEQYIFHLLVPLDGSNNGFIINCIIESIILIPMLTIIILTIFINYFKIQPVLKLCYAKKEKNINIFPFSFSKKNFLIISIFLFIISAFLLLNHFGLTEYIKNNLQTTTIYEEYYVDPKDVKIKFPKEKKNLILIYLESMETSFSSVENGGIMNKSYIPNLDKIAKNNISFSNKYGGGISDVMYSSWTIAGLVSTSSGIPLKIAVDGNSYGNYNDFLPNATSLGDILNKEGYHQTIMIGSDINFAGRNKYYSLHGNYNIFDYYTAIEKGIIDQDYYVWWGYEDRILFENAKDYLTTVSKEDQPFNLTLLTVDTHAFDGYQDPECEQKYASLYSNAIFCSDQMVNNFINWIKKQDFYKNTTIVIVGDHLSMDYKYFKDFTDQELSKRSVYNAFINPFTTPSNTTNRTFTAFDVYPSILASMGAEIEGNKLALGVNLFSDEKTIPEHIGLDNFNNELSKTSKFYNETFIYNKK